jgi:hypothetical protein
VIGSDETSARVHGRVGGNGCLSARIANTIRLSQVVGMT